MELAQLPRPALTPARYSSKADDEIVAAIAGGSDAAFEALYERHCPGMLALARQILDSPSEAEDAVQQAFTSAYRELSDGFRPEYPRAWLYAIARNRCLTVIRDRREVASEELEPAEPSTVGLAEEVERRSDLRDLLKAMHGLPEEQRTALALFELGGLSQTEIGQAMHCSPDRVKALVHQARTNLAHRRAATEASCESIREQLSVARGGRLNSRELRMHLRDCEGCSEYALMVREQRRRLAIVLPVVPLIAMKLPAIAGSTAAGGGLGGGALGSSVGRKLAWLRPRGSAAYVAAGAASVAAAGAIAVAAVGPGEDPPPQKKPVRPAAVTPAGPAPAVAATATPAAKPRRAAKRRRKARAAPAAQRPAEARAPEAAPAPVPAATPEPAAATSSPPPRSPSPSPAPAAPQEPPSQSFDLRDPGPPPGAPQETPASEAAPEAPAAP